MKKRVFIAAICFILIFVPSFSVLALNTKYEYYDFCKNGISLYVDGVKITADNYVRDGIAYIPLRAVAEAIGYDVSWNDSIKRGDLTKKNTGTTTANETKAQLMLANLYKDAQLLLISMVTPTSGASNTAMTMAYSGNYDGAYSYFKDVKDNQLTFCIKIIEEDIIPNYSEVLTKYNLQNNTEYKNKYNTLSTMLTDVKTKTNSFSQATLYYLQTGIKSTDANVKSQSYADYINALQGLINLIQDYSTKFETEYENIMENVVGSDYSIIKSDD